MKTNIVVNIAKAIKKTILVTVGSNPKSSAKLPVISPNKSSVENTICITVNVDWNATSKVPMKLNPSPAAAASLAVSIFSV